MKLFDVQQHLFVVVSHLNLGAKVVACPMEHRMHPRCGGGCTRHVEVRELRKNTECRLVGQSCRSDDKSYRVEDFGPPITTSEVAVEAKSSQRFPWPMPDVFNQASRGFAVDSKVSESKTQVLGAQLVLA